MQAPQAQATDFQLLSDFAADGDEAAFATIVQRHGAMVRGVGRRILGDPAGADDAFQAAFISLARHARSLAETEQNTDSLGSWLYRVAVNSALQLKRKAKSRRRCETTFAAQRQADLRARASRDEWLPVLDEEIGALPDRYQSPLVLCHLEGRTQQDAADELGLTYATIRRRLKQAKILLRERLARRGLSEAGALLVPLLAQAAAVSSAPAEAAIQTVTASALAHSAVAPAASTAAASSTAATVGTVKTTAGGLSALLSGKSTAVLTLTLIGGLTAGLCAATLAWDSAGERLTTRRSADPFPPSAAVIDPVESTEPTADVPSTSEAARWDDVADIDPDDLEPIRLERLTQMPDATAAASPADTAADNAGADNAVANDPKIQWTSAITPELLTGVLPAAEPDLALGEPLAEPPAEPEPAADAGQSKTAEAAESEAGLAEVVQILNQQRERIARERLDPAAGSVRAAAGKPRVFKGAVTLEGHEQRFYTAEQADALLGWLEQQPAPPADSFRAAFHIDGLTFEVRDFGLALDVLREKRPLN